MTRRFRFATVLIAIITLFAFAAESAAALAFCQPAAAAHEADGDDRGSHRDHDGPAAPSGESGSNHGSQCPIGMIGGGSCAVATLPAGPTQMQNAPVTTDRGWAASISYLRSAAAQTLFRPPRA